MQYVPLYAYNTEIKIAGQDITFKRFLKKQVRGYSRKESSGKSTTLEEIAAAAEKEKKVAARRFLNKHNAELSGQAAEVDTEQLKRFRKSVYRAKTKIFDIIACNAGKWGKHTSKFVTLTFAENVDRLEDANAAFKDFIKRLNYAVYGKEAVLKYLCVPELQSRGVWHYHVVFFNLPIIPVNMQKAVSLINRGIIKKGEGCTKNLSDIWGHGFVGMNCIKDNARVAAYVSKYLTKGVDVDAAGKVTYKTEGEDSGLKRMSDYNLYKSLGLQNMKRYQASKGLHKPEIFYINADAEELNTLKDAVLKGDKLLKLDKTGRKMNRYTYENEYRGKMHIINMRIKKKHLSAFVQKMNKFRDETRKKYMQRQAAIKLKYVCVDYFIDDRRNMLKRINKGFEFIGYISDEEISNIFACKDAV